MDKLRQVVVEQQPDEGWLISNRRVAPAAKKKLEDRDYRDLYCYTLDEVIDQVADFGQYLTWLETEICQKGIDQDYIPLGCSKDEIDPKSHQKIGVSHYGEDEGWIEGYVDQWLADSTKEHLSVLGEFGTGKTWFALRYAWLALQKYKEAKQRGIVRPRLPLVIPLRDYAKTVSAESLFSEFFFRKHEIPLPSYKSFQQLNRMGKLLLIFDGFDEMAARINQQAMIDNFWELAKVVVPGAKAILTCRTEHFPDAIAGRKLLNAELKASTANLTGEPPQFEVLELAKFKDEQIGELLGRKAKTEAVSKVMDNPQLLDLARRPVMVELILEALPEIEQGKPIDMARVYLYAVTRKMERDIKSERTFTSMADKLYFLCELSWEMLSTDRMSLNYRSFPKRLQQMFANRVKDEKELDHWRYDMMGQTMLIRNSEGDYSPAHRSLLEFFVAYKIVASLGAMADDFTALARQQSHLDESLPPQSYTWESYFKRSCNEHGIPKLEAPLSQFENVSFDVLLELLSQTKLVKAVLDLAYPMLDHPHVIRERLLPLVQKTREKSIEDVGYLGGNITQLMLAQTPYALVDSDLKEAKLCGVDFTQTYLQRVILRNAHLREVNFSKVIGSVYSVAFNPKNSEQIAIGDSKGTVQVWNSSTDQVFSFCIGHKNPVRAVTFSSDGKYLASGSEDNLVKLWSVESSKCTVTLEGHKDYVRSVAFNPDTTCLASGSADTTVKLWSVKSGKCIGTLEGHQHAVQAVVFSPDGIFLASSSIDTTVKLWSVKDGKCTSTLKGHQNRVNSVVFSPDGMFLASGSADDTVKLWSVKHNECTCTLRGHQAAIFSVAFSLDGKYLTSASADNTVKLWAVESGKCIGTLEGHQDWVRSVAFSPDSQHIASGSADHTVKLWSVELGEYIRSLKGKQATINSVAFSPDNTYIASSSDDGEVKLWSAESGELIHTLKGHQNWVTSVAFSPNGLYLVSGSYDNNVRIWSVESGECIRILEDHNYWVRSVVFSPDGKHVASGSADTTVKLWSVDTGQCILTLKGHKATVNSVVFSPDSTCLTSGSADTTVKQWSIDLGECIQTLEGHEGWVRSVAISSDGKYIVSASADHTVKLWSVESGQCNYTFKGHQNWVRSVMFSPDNKYIASGSEDSMVKLWSVASGKCSYTFKGHQNTVNSVAFSPNSKYLASGSEDVTIRIWDVAAETCLQVINDKPCGETDITGVKGLTIGQRAVLKLMGAIDRNDGGVT